MDKVKSGEVEDDVIRWIIFLACLSSTACVSTPMFRRVALFVPTDRALEASGDEQAIQVYTAKEHPNDAKTQLFWEEQANEVVRLLAVMPDEEASLYRDIFKSLRTAESDAEADMISLDRGRSTLGRARLRMARTARDFVSFYMFRQTYYAEHPNELPSSDAPPERTRADLEALHVLLKDDSALTQSVLDHLASMSLVSVKAGDDAYQRTRQLLADVTRSFDTRTMQLRDVIRGKRHDADAFTDERYSRQAMMTLLAVQSP